MIKVLDAFNKLVCKIVGPNTVEIKRNGCITIISFDKDGQATVDTKRIY